MEKLISANKNHLNVGFGNSTKNRNGISPPADLEVNSICNLEIVSTVVKSPTEWFPGLHGMSDISSGHLPSSRLIPQGSKSEEIPAVVKALLIMSLTVEWR